MFDVRLEQWMYLQADGRTMLNRGTVRKFGVTVAQIAEEFRRTIPRTAGARRHPRNPGRPRPALRAVRRIFRKRYASMPSSDLHSI